MTISNIIKSIMLFILSAGFSFIVLLAYGRYTAELIYLLGFFGLTAYVVLDLQVWIKLNILIKYIVAICCGIIYRVYDLNNYEVDTRKFEYYDQGFLVKHEPEIKVFRFIDFNDLFLIMVITTMMLIIYIILKYITNKFLNK